MDDFDLLFGSKDWKEFDDNSPMEDFYSKVPQTDEVDRIEVRKENERATIALDTAKKRHANKMAKLRSKMKSVKVEQDALKSNLSKFNTFVREKELKAMKGVRVEQEEKELSKAIDLEMEGKTQLLTELTRGKDFLLTAVGKRKKFHEFLNAVVAHDSSRNRYKDIGELMRRCETLVATRQELTSARDRIKASIEETEESLAIFKEEQNERILELSAKQNELQEKYYVAEARRQETLRLMDVEAKEDISTQLLVANIKLSILTLCQYVHSKKIVLPGDKKEEAIKDKTLSLDAQLAAVLAHIEDLEVVIERVRRNDNIEGYLDPLLSEFSELRIDH